MYTKIFFLSYILLILCCAIFYLPFIPLNILAYWIVIVVYLVILVRPQFFYKYNILHFSILFIYLTVLTHFFTLFICDDVLKTSKIAEEDYLWRGCCCCPWQGLSSTFFFFFYIILKRLYTQHNTITDEYFCHLFLGKVSLTDKT